MSRETMEWLNTHCLIGDTDQRSTAWHYRADLQLPLVTASGREYIGNHYPGAIPVADVVDRLYGWEIVSLPVYVKVACSEDEAMDAAKNGGAIVRENLVGNHPVTGELEPYVQWYRFVERPTRQNISASDDVEGSDFYMGKSGFTIHPYEEWLITNVANLVDDEVHISSAGLLDNRAQSWVEISMSETQTVADFAFRPHLLAVTGVNGKTATQYGRKVQAVVCDNTLNAALGETGQSIKYRHSRYSVAKIADARSALGILVATADEFSAQVTDLVEWKITGKAFNDVLNSLIPSVTDPVTGKPLGKTAVRNAEVKRGEIQKMWVSDPRVAPWKGTALGVLQAFNTYDHHFRNARSATVVAERNMIDAINGKQDARDASVMDALASFAAR